ncbi:MAG: iron chelate uptake ABC transporter family permease subunit [Acholeplasmataceae bacterium]|nr:iron chelate uptake ABC transporter family permease subunit [Acholeplasmataceae bacterium]
MTKRFLMHKRLILVIVWLILVILSLRIGVLDFTFKKLFSGDLEAQEVLLVSRIPRTVSIIIAATGMSIAGLIMQSISRNRFISPTTAGTTDAAILGLLLGYLLFNHLNIYQKTLIAFAFSLLLTGLFLMILRRIRFKNVIYVPLLGMMYGALISALSTFIAHRYQASQFLGTIGVGGFHHLAQGTYELLYIIVPVLIVAYLYANKFSIAVLGEDFAKNLGVSYQTVTIVGLVIIAMVSSLTFVTVGMLPFIGLVVPNLVSIYYGDHVKKTMIDIALFGSAFVLLNDIISRLVVKPYEVPVSFTMGITGAVIFIWLIFRRMKRG